MNVILSVTMCQSLAPSGGKPVVAGRHGGWIFEMI